MVNFDEKKQTEYIAAIKKREEEELASILSKKYKIPYINLFRISVDMDALILIDEDLARDAGLVILQKGGKTIDVAVKNPTLQKTKDAIKVLEKKGRNVRLHLTSISGLEYIWQRYKEVSKGAVTYEGLISIPQSQLDELKTSLKNFNFLASIITNLVAKGSKMNVTSLIQLVLASSLRLDASDIHLKTEESEVVLRLRMDGVLHKITSFTHETYRLLLSRIKLLSGLKLNVRDRAQDGRFTIRVVDTDVEIRTSVLPGPFGETVVLRILNPKTIGLELEDLGMQPSVEKIILREIMKPNGMILTTGPTGSGKTTTLYAFIKRLNSPEINIVTIENPVEYHIEGITQTQVSRAGNYTFDKALQAILRQDPDVILVGEIRNIETARAALQAALTGHLVFSTLHTNNAPATIPRLIDIGAKPNIIAPAVNLAIAQRLLRRLCQKCKYEYSISDRELDYVERIVKNFPTTFKKPDIANAKFWKADGCDYCNKIGYKGRIGVFEVFEITEIIEKLIFTNPSEAEVLKTATEQGMLQLHQDGVLKALAGMTTISEILRIAGEY